MATKFDSLFSDIEQEEGTQNTSPEVGGKFDSVFSDLESQQNINYNVAVDAALRNDPDRFAQTKQLASEAGVSTDVAERNKDRIEHEVKKSQLDYQALAKKNPILARQLSKLEFANVAHDDVDALSNVEQTARFLVDGDPSFRKTRFFTGGITRDLVGRTLSGLGETLDIMGRNQDNPFLRGMPLSELTLPIAGLLSDPVRDTGEAVKEFSEDVIIPDVEPTKLDQVATGLGQVSGQIVAVALAPQIAIPSMYAQGVDITAERIKHDPVASAAPEELKDAEMLVGGGITAVTEYVSSKLFLKTPQSFAIRNKLLDYAAKAAVGLTNEAIQETTESLLQDVSHIVFTNPDSQISVKQALAEGEIAGYVGAIMQTAINSALHIKARKTMATFERLNEASSAQKLRERSPADYQDYADAVAKHLADTSEGRVSDVYVDSEVFNQIMNEAGIQRDFINEQFPEIVEQLQETDSLGGGDIRLPMNKWIGKVAGTEIGAALTPHLRSSPEALSFAETQQTQDMQDEIEARSDEIVEEAITNKQFNDSAREVESTIFEQVKSTQHFPDPVSRNYASFVRDFYVARAKEEGVTPGEIYERYSMNVVASDQISPQQVLNQAAESGYTGDNAIEATEWVRAVEKGLDMSQEARMQRARDMGFDVDQVYYHGTDADIKSFSVSRSSDVIGDNYYFSSNPQVANTYTKGEGGNVGAFYLNLGSVKRIDAKGNLWTNINNGNDDGLIQNPLFNGDAATGARGDNNEPMFIKDPRGTVERKNITQAVIEAKQEGYDALIVDNVVDSGTHAESYRFEDDGGSNTTVIFDPANIRSINAAFDPDFSDSANLLAQETRGGFDPKTLTAILNTKADYSTFLHESAHFFLEVYSDLAASENASDQIKQDMQTLLDWFGESDLDTWNNKTLDERRKAHEQFAYNFELYLFEGKAPSIQLQSIFDRFAAWLRRVYRSIKEELNTAYRAENGEDLPILTGEVRDVMDRMLASEDQIEQAQLVRKSVPLYASQEDSGMSDDEWHAYQSMRQEADDVAVSELSKDSVRQMQWLSGAKSRVLKELQRKKKRVRKRIRSEVEQDMMSEPVFALMRYLRFGETVDDQGEIVSAEGSTKLNVTEIHELYDGVEDAPDYKSLKYGKNGMLSKDGLSPEFVADMFGYPSADALVRKLVDTPSIEDEVSRRTDRRMLEEFAELTDDQSIEKAVNEALHNEARARFVAVELKHVSKSTRPVRVMVQAAKIAAQNILSNKTIDSIKPKQYIAAEARAAKDVLNSMRQGDTAAAANAKQRELLNNQLASEAMKIQEEVEKITNHFRRLSGKGAQNNMRGDYLEQLNNILARFDLRKSATIKQRTDERIPLAEFIKSESDRLSAVVPDLPSWVLADDYKKHYRDLTVGEIRDLSDSVKQIEQLARREEKMYRAVRDQTYQQEIESILGELEAVHPDAFDKDGLPIQYRKDRLPFVKDKRMRLRSKFDAEFLNMENLLDVMSAGKGKQIFESVFGRLSKAADDRNEYMKKVGAKINEATAAYTTKERLAMTTKKERVSGTDRYMTREERITVALYYGSLDGRQRLTDGNKLTEYEINQIIDSLDAKDVALLKAVWSTSDEIIWPDLRDLNKRTAGIAPKKIPPAPFETRHGTVSGGYVPLVYDGDLDSRALDLNTNATVQELLGGNSGTAATQRSASKERISVVNRPLDLSLRAMAFKINETVHDITHREAIADTYRLLQSKRFSNAIRTIAGPDVYKAMVSRVREVAVKPRTPSGFSEKAFWYLRKNTLVSLMGASFNTVAINVLGVTPAIRRVGGLRFLKAMAKFPYHLGPIHKGNKYHDMVIEKSQYMKNRLEGFDRDLNEELSRVLGKQGIMPSLGFWFAGLSAMDRMITMPTWLAAYEKGMELNKNDDAAAVEYADRVVRQTQGSGRPIDLAQVAGGVGTAGEFKRIITMFYNFFSSQLGSIRRGGAIANHKWKEGQKAQAAAQLTLDALMIVVIPATLEAMARGQCGDDPDASDYLYCAGRSSALFTGAFFPIFRDVLPYTWKQFDPDIQSFRVAISPVESALETLARAPKAIADISSGNGTEADQRTLVKGFGYLFGLPGSQAWRTLDGFKALSDGETNDPTVVLTGPRE